MKTGIFTYVAGTISIFFVVGLIIANQVMYLKPDYLSELDFYKYTGIASSFVFSGLAFLFDLLHTRNNNYNS